MRRRHNDVIFAGTACENDEMVSHVHACPCCGHHPSVSAGLRDPSVCFWEDDGQTTSDAHLDRVGPHRRHLWRLARTF